MAGAPVAVTLLRAVELPAELELELELKPEPELELAVAEVDHSDVEVCSSEVVGAAVVAVVAAALVELEAWEEALVDDAEEVVVVSPASELLPACTMILCQEPELLL